MEAKDMVWAISGYEMLVHRFTPLNGPLAEARGIAFWDTVSKMSRKHLETTFNTFKMTWNQRNRHNEPMAPTPDDIYKECKRLLTAEEAAAEKARQERESQDAAHALPSKDDLDQIIDESGGAQSEAGRRITHRIRELMASGKSMQEASSEAFYGLFK